MASDVYGLYTVYWGGAGLNSQSPYMADQVKALQELGITNVHYSIQGGSSTGTGLKDMGFDALAVKKYRRDFDGKDYVFDTNMKHKPNSCNLEQLNYIGYSYGSLLASHTAMYYANRGYVVDNLVLIGSPIGKYFLDKLQRHKNIKNVIVVDLRQYGDPIYAGMSEFDLMSGMTLDNLAFQFAKGDYSGHFYYSGDNSEGQKRRRELAKYLWQKGLR